MEIFDLLGKKEGIVKYHRNSYPFPFCKNKLGKVCFEGRIKSTKEKIKRFLEKF